MQYIDSPNNAGSRPACAAGSVVPKWFQNCSAPGAQDGTVLNADWLNDIQGNIMAVLNAAGITPTPCRDEDLLDALNAIIAAASGPATIPYTNIVGLPPNVILMTDASGMIVAAPTGYDFGSY